MRSRATGEEVAAKCLKRASTWSPEKFRQRVGEEVAALQHTRHRNVIGLIDHLPDAGGEDRYWVVMKYARGGQLLERLIARHQSTRPYTEVEVAKIAYDVLSGLKHLHDRRIAHCDIKPDNIMFETDEDGTDGNLVLVDLGFATVCESGQYIDQMKGTIEYMAPEILSPRSGQARAYDTKVDIWSVGCVLYMLLSGELPFRRAWGNIDQREFHKRVRCRRFCARAGTRGAAGPPTARCCFVRRRFSLAARVHQPKCRYLITQGDINFSSAAWGRISPAARELVAAMLTRQPSERPNVEACLSSPWFLAGAAVSTSLPAGVLQELANFNMQRGSQSYTSHCLSGLQMCVYNLFIVL
jgi:serine/threonine protein kinase